MTSRRISSEEGQTAVEFALVAPFGVAFHDYVTITDAARAGARKAIVARFNGGSTSDAVQAVRDSAAQLNQSKLGVDVSDPQWNTPGSVVTVTATYPYTISIPLLGMTVSSGTLTAVAKEKLE